MDLARSQFKTLSSIYEQDNIFDLIQKNNVRVVIAGDIDGQLKNDFPDVRDGFLKIQERTKNNTRMTMYLCFAYDSILDLNQAIESSEEIKGEKGKEKEQEIKPEDIFGRLMVPHYIDLLVRTSGESRLSNFMLPQASYGLVYIEKSFWPSFSMIILAKILLNYNYHYPHIQAKKLSLTNISE